VVAGTIDAWAEATSVGVVAPGDAMLMYGTTMFIIEAVDRYRPDRTIWATAGVDPASRREFWTRIHKLAGEGKTIIVTTHYMDEASQCGRLAFLSRGLLVGLGTPQEVMTQFNEPTIEDVFISLQAKDER